MVQKNNASLRLLKVQIKLYLKTNQHIVRQDLFLAFWYLPAIVLGPACALKVFIQNIYNRMSIEVIICSLSNSGPVAKTLLNSLLYVMDVFQTKSFNLVPGR